MITVEQLRRKLANMPAKAVVVWCDHDHAADMYNSFVNSVCVEDDLLPVLRERGYKADCVVALRG